MENTTKFTLSTIIAILVLSASYLITYPPKFYRHEVIVKIETPEGLRSGSAVREVFFQDGPEILPDIRSDTRGAKGEAVVIKISKEKYVFALLGGEAGIFIEYFLSSDSNDPIDASHSSKLKKFVKQIDYPRLVAFRDLTNPMTVHMVGPDSGIRIQAVEIKIVDRAITRKITEILPWLGDLHGKYLHGGNMDRGAPLGLHGGDFKRGS